MDGQEQQCIFCQIASGKIPAKKVYEDDQFLGVLDINPATPGHVLLLSKKHVAIMPQMDASQILQLAKATKELSKSMIQHLKVEGTSVFAANGVAAGQRAPHFMLHVIPRKEDDGVNLQLPQVEIDQKVMEGIAKNLQVSVGRQFGVELKEEKAEYGSQITNDHEPKTNDQEPKTKNQEPEDDEESDSGADETSENGEKSNLDELTNLLAGGGR